MTSLPAGLRTGIDALLERQSRRVLAVRAQATSAAYRAGLGSSASICDADSVLAYVVARMPATFAATSAALREAAGRIGADYAPARLLDIACGPGTATFAAAGVWPSLVHATLIDRDARMLATARRLFETGCLAPSLAPSYEFLQGEVETALAALPTFDLVIVGYGLAELPPTAASDVVECAWGKCSGLLVVVEPGSMAGFARVRAAREMLIAQGGAIVAPCCHGAACPMPQHDWCHFVQRLQRSRDHMMTKDARVPFEDEKYAYVAAARTLAAPRPHGRILKQTKLSKGGWAGEICIDGDIARWHISRRDPDFKHIRKLGWGDAVSEPT